MCVVGFFLAGSGWKKLKSETEKMQAAGNSPKSWLSERTFGKMSLNTNSNLVSIIIPCFNEASNIQSILLFIERNAQNPENLEIICVDGGSEDGWPSKVQELQSLKLLTIPTKIVNTGGRTGRGICQNIGAEHANADIFLFLHADTIVSEGFDEVARKSAYNPNIVVGSFEFTVDRSLMNYPLVGIGCMEYFARVRNHWWWLPYGDQAYFIHREMYGKLGGMPDIVFLEDLRFTSIARKYALVTGGIIHVDKMNAYCSPRRWQKNGVALNTMWNQIVVFCAVYLQYSPADCYKLYYGHYPSGDKGKKAN